MHIVFLIRYHQIMSHHSQHRNIVVSTRLNTLSNGRLERNGILYTYIWMHTAVYLLFDIYISC